MNGRAGILRQFLTFAGVGALATGLQYVILVAGVQVLNLDPVLASTVGFTVSAVLNYALNHRVTFGSTVAHRRAFPRFVTVVCVGLVLTALLMDLGVHRFHFHYLPVQLVTTAIVLLWNFIASRRWTFYDSGPNPD